MTTTSKNMQMHETNQDPAPPDRRSGLSPRGLQGLFAAAVVLALVALLWPRGEFETVPGGFLLDAEGRPTPLGPRLGPVTLVHLWATWCPPCIGEIPTLHRLSADFASDPDFRVLFVAVDDTVSQVESFMGGDHASRVLYDPEWAISKKFGTRKLPESHLVVDGNVVETFVGAQDWDEPAVRARLRKAMEGSRAD